MTLETWALVTEQHVHRVLARCHFICSELSHAHVAAFKLLARIADDDALLVVGPVTHGGGQRSPVTRLQG